MSGNSRVAWAAYFRERDAASELRQERAKLRQQLAESEAKAQKADSDAALWFGVSLVLAYLLLHTLLG